VSSNHQTAQRRADVDDRRNPVIAWGPKDGSRCWVTPALTGALFSAIFAGCPHAARSAALTCGPQPDIAPAELRTRIDGDAKVAATVILQARPPLSRRFVVAQRNEMRHKYAAVEPVAIDRFMLWATCQVISNDPTQTGSQKFDRYADVYRLMSEPGKDTAPAE
jgi:hypothetical protein